MNYPVAIFLILILAAFIVAIVVMDSKKSCSPTSSSLRISPGSWTPEQIGALSIYARQNSQMMFEDAESRANGCLVYNIHQKMTGQEFDDGTVNDNGNNAKTLKDINKQCYSC